MARSAHIVRLPLTLPCSRCQWPRLVGAGSTERTTRSNPSTSQRATSDGAEICVSRTQTFVANRLPCMSSAPGVQRMPPIEHWMPPSAAGKDAPIGGLRATYAHDTAHLRCSLQYHMPNKHLRLSNCAPVFAHSRILGAQLDQSASGQHRMHADYTQSPGWNTCISPTQQYVPRFIGVRRVQRPAKRSWRLQPAKIVGVWPFAATAPTAGRRGAPSRSSMRSTVRTRCIRCAWRLGSSGAPRP